MQHDQARPQVKPFAARRKNKLTGPTGGPPGLPGHTHRAPSGRAARHPAAQALFADFGTFQGGVTVGAPKQ